MHYHIFVIMKDEFTALHPDVNWIKVGKDKVQLRQPDGEYITFDKYCKEIIDVFCALQSPAKKKTVDQEIFRQIKDLLQVRGLLVDEKMATEHQIVRLINQRGASGGLVKDNTVITNICALGKGKLANVSRKALSQAGIEITDKNDCTALMVVFCDQEDHNFMREANIKAIKNEQPVLFFYWGQNEFKIGPFVLPHKTACLECTFKRELASTNNPEEILSFRTSNPTSFPSFEGGPVLDDLAGALITRQIMSILKGNYDLASPGSIITFNPVSLDTRYSPVVRLPRCKTCGTNLKNPLRAIRDMI